MVVADPRLRGGDLIVDGLFDQRLDLRRNVDTCPGRRKAGVAERHLRRLGKVARLESRAWNHELQPLATGVIHDTPVASPDYGHKS